jgi:hypothetical protein
LKIKNKNEDKAEKNQSNGPEKSVVVVAADPGSNRSSKNLGPQYAEIKAAALKEVNAAIHKVTFLNFFFEIETHAAKAGIAAKNINVPVIFTDDKANLVCSFLSHACASGLFDSKGLLLPS